MASFALYSIVRLELFVIGYPCDFYVNYVCFNGFLCNVFYSFQNLGKALQTFWFKKSSQRTLLILKFVIDMVS